MQAVGAGLELPVILQKDPDDPEKKSETVVAVPVAARGAGPGAFTVDELVRRMADSREGGSLAQKAGAQTIALQAQEITLTQLFSPKGSPSVLLCKGVWQRRLEVSLHVGHCRSRSKRPAVSDRSGLCAH